MTKTTAKHKLISLALMFTLILGSFAFLPSGKADAASGWGRIKDIEVSALRDDRAFLNAHIDMTTIKGYITDAYGWQLYKGSKLIQEDRYRCFYLHSLKPSTKYTYKIRTFKDYKQKQYWNSTKKKWQSKKPAAKDWKGKKTRKVKKRKYGDFKKVTFTTKKKVNYRTDLDNIREEVCKKLSKYTNHLWKVRPWMRSTAEEYCPESVTEDGKFDGFYLDDRLNDAAQLQAEEIYFNENWPEAHLQVRNISCESKYILKFTKNKLMYSFDFIDTYEELADTDYAYNKYLGIGYYKGVLVGIWMTQENLDKAFGV